MNRRYRYQEPFKVVALQQVRERFEQSDCSGTSEDTCTPIYTAKAGEPPISGGCRWIANRCYPNTLNPDMVCPMKSSEKDCTNAAVNADDRKPICTWVANYQKKADDENDNPRCLKYAPGPMCFNASKVPPSPHP